MKKILVLCTGNSCRSQILEGWMKTLSNGDYLTFSAGIEAHGINKDAVYYMNEVDIDLSNHTSDLIEKYRDIKFDLFVTVCDSAKESCPIVPNSAKIIHRNINDPSKAKDKPRAFRRARLELKNLAEEIDLLIRN